MGRLQFRNLTATPDDPVDQWGVEGILTAIDRGSLSHWRRLVAAVRTDPWGPTAADLDQALDLADDAGVAASLRRILTQIRVHAVAAADTAAREEVRRRLQTLIAESGLTAAQFAQRLGTSASRMSTYMTGRVVPSAAVLVHAENVSRSAAEAANRAGQ
jgi:DNA-binding transcriptional regulator YiaG